ncbi:CIAO1 protein, partial [Syrrhaptes paradoxus]|nr:CIAO1 protein [Syrrhaptes paradoxus]
VDEEEEYECVSVLNSHTQDVKHVVWHPTQELLASASYDDTVKLYHEEEDDWVCCATLEGHDSTVWSVAFDRSGERLASCSDDKTVRVWQRYKPGNEEGVACSGTDPTWKCICTLSGYHTRTIYDVAWCHLTGALATACGDDAIRVFEESASCDPRQPTFSLAAHIPRAHSQDVNCNSSGRAGTLHCSASVRSTSVEAEPSRRKSPRVSFSRHMSLMARAVFPVSFLE